MKRFGSGILVGVLVVYGGIAAAYAGLAAFRPDSVPAPAISRLAPLDEKLRFLRRNPRFDPAILAVGSSVTWRQLAGRHFSELAGDDTNFLNGATGFLKIHQSRDLLRFYLSRFENVRSVLLLAGPTDFADCSDEPARLLDHGDAAAYAFEGAPELYFYFRYFAPQRYLRGAVTLERQKQPFVGDLYHDRYGSSPLHVPETMVRGLRYGAIEPDAACRTALVGLAEDLAARDIRLLVVFAPIHPRYRQRHPDVIDWMRAVAADVTARTAGRLATVRWLVEDEAYAAADFFDAFHLQWPAVNRLSRELAARMSPAPTSPIARTASRKRPRNKRRVGA